MTPQYHRKLIDGLEVLVVPGDKDGAHIVLFHGFGANGFDLLPLSGTYQERPKPTWYFPTGPLAVEIGVGYEGKAWFPIHFERLKKGSSAAEAFPTSLESIRVKCEQVIAALEIPLSKLIVGGFSQGAVLATELALHSFQRYAGLVIWSGTLVQPESWSKLAHAQAGLPFFQSHGDNDPLLPLAGAEALATVLQEGGLKGELHAFKGGHEIPQQILRKFASFLAAHLKPSA